MSNIEPVLVHDPVSDPRWGQTLATFPAASVFFSAAWARVLQDSYAYRPVYLLLRRGEEILGCLPLMEMKGFRKSCRGAALPFTDECGPLALSPEWGRRVLDEALTLGRARGWRSLDMHGGAELLKDDSKLESQEAEGAFHGHVVQLDRSPEELLSSFEGSIRRGIKAAERAGVEIEFAEPEEGVRLYYGLHCRTRQRHGLPPQPWSFFEHIRRHLLEAGLGFVVLARHRARPIAGAVFLHRGKRAIYKYGASDRGAQGLRPNNLVMWRAIRHLMEQGMETLDLGRTSLANAGLRRFKEGWGASEHRVSYARYNFREERLMPIRDRAHGFHNAVFERIPVFMLRVLGRVLYRYCG